MSRLEEIRERFNSPMTAIEGDDDVTWLLAEVDRLREALRPFADCAFPRPFVEPSVADYRRAAAALQEAGETKGELPSERTL